jgi:hypothetical protein
MLGRAGDHHPEVCDCSPYVTDGGFNPHDCCDGLRDTFAAVEQIIRERTPGIQAAAWDEGMSAWRTYLDGGRVPPNPYRDSATGGGA